MQPQIQPREQYKTQIQKMAEAIDPTIQLYFPNGQNYIMALIETKDGFQQKIIESHEIEGLRHDQLMEPSNSINKVGVKGWMIIAAKLEGLSRLANHQPVHLE
jgi:hypothetical protein